MGVKQIGQPIQAVCIFAAAYGHDSNGEAMIYAVSSGKPCIFYAIKAITGECLHRSELTGSKHTWGITIAPDGTVYIGGDGLLYRWSDDLPQVEVVGVPIEGETYFWRLDTDSIGRVYGGTYPNGKVFQYDPLSGAFRDYGQLVEGAQYARSLSVHRNAGRDTIYAGLGTQRACIVELDVERGDKREIPVPSGYKGEQLVYDLDVVGDRMYVRFTPSEHLFVYDLEAGVWVQSYEEAPGLDVSPPHSDGTVYFLKAEELHGYKSNTNELAGTGLRIVQPTRDYGWLKLNTPEYPGLTLLSIQQDGVYWMYNPETGRSSWSTPSLEGVPVPIQSLARGPDGQVYMGGYLAGGFAEYEPQYDRLTAFPGIGQTEGMTAHGGKLYLGVYPKARIYEFDPSKQWDFGHNPVELFSLKDAIQDRPFAIASAGDKLAIGTVPSYGRLGGALTIYSPDSGSLETYVDLVPKSSIVSLQYREGLLFGGTSIWGGLGAVPKEKEAKLFIWDMQTSSIQWVGVPLPGERALTALTFDEKGTLWGLTVGWLFRMDPSTRRLLFRKQLFPFEWSSVKHCWRGGFLRFGSDKRLYGTALSRFFAYDPQADTLEVLADSASLLTNDCNGNFYFASGEKLVRYELPDRPECST